MALLLLRMDRHAGAGPGACLSVAVIMQVHSAHAVRLAEGSLCVSPCTFCSNCSALHGGLAPRPHAMTTCNVCTNFLQTSSCPPPSCSRRSRAALAFSHAEAATAFGCCGSLRSTPQRETHRKKRVPEVAPAHVCAALPPPVASCHTVAPLTICCWPLCQPRRAARRAAAAGCQRRRPPQTSWRAANATRRGRPAPLQAPDAPLASTQNRWNCVSYCRGSPMMTKAQSFW